MSGVGITGLIANLPGTSTPYPTQDPALEIGGWRSVANAAARDAIPANFRAIGMQVALQDTGLTYQLVGGIANANWKVAYNAPFFGRFFVDATFTGYQTGSSSNPYTSCAAAFAAAAAAGIGSGILMLPPGVKITENVVFPLTGSWELATDSVLGFILGGITGTIDVSCSTTARRALTRMNVSGAVSGLAAAGGSSRFILTDCFLSSSLTLTSAGGAFWRCSARSSPIEGVTGGPGTVGGIISGAVSVSGAWYGTCYNLSGASLAFTQSSQHTFGDLPPIVQANAASITLWMNGISNALGGNISFVNAGGGTFTLQPDGASLTEMMRFGVVTTGAVTLFSELGGRGAHLVSVSNFGPNLVCGPIPGGLMVCEACLTLLTKDGATVGAAVLNVTYTDATGTVVTEAVTTALNVAGAVGSKARGSLPFSQNGAVAGVSVSVTGIVNASSLTYQCDYTVRQAT